MAHGILERPVARLRISLALAALAAACIAGCASPRYAAPRVEWIERSAQSKPMRVVAIAAGQYDTLVDLSALTTLQKSTDLQKSMDPAKAVGGAAAGAIGGSGVALLLCLASPLGPACAAGGSVIAGGAVIGAGAGLSRSRPANSGSPASAEERAAADSVRRELKPQSLLYAAVMKRAQALSSVTFTESRIPNSVNLYWSELSTDYSALAAEGVEAVLEIHLVNVQMSDPTLLRGAELTMTAGARLVRVLNSTVLYRAEYRYVSEPLAPAQWTENNAEKLRQALLRGIDDLAQRIVAAALTPERTSTEGHRVRER